MLSIAESIIKVIAAEKKQDTRLLNSKEESDYNYEVEREKARVKTKSIGIAFVTFRTLSDAKKMLDDFKHSCRCFSGIVGNFITVNLNRRYFSKWCIGSPKTQPFGVKVVHPARRLLL